MEKSKTKVYSDRIDLIIPTYKPDAKFDELIERIMKQTILPGHIYVINTEEQYFDDVKYAFAPNLTVTHIKKEEFDHGGTRNYGASLSSAEFVMFMTQDAMPSNPYLIENILDGFQNQKVAAVYAQQLPRKNARYIEKYTRTFNYPEEDRIKTKADLETLGIKTFFCSNVCAAYRKSMYNEMGGFVSKTIFNEDMIMAARLINAGYSIYYASKAKVVHSHNYSCIQQLHRNFDLAVSQQQYREIFDQVKSESEGIKLVKKSVSYLHHTKHHYLIPNLILQSGFKFIGYKLGRNYEKLPKWLILKLTMNKSFWKEV